MTNDDCTTTAEFISAVTSAQVEQLLKRMPMSSTPSLILEYFAPPSHHLHGHACIGQLEIPMYQPRDRRTVPELRKLDLYARRHFEPPVEDSETPRASEDDADTAMRRWNHIVRRWAVSSNLEELTSSALGSSSGDGGAVVHWAGLNLMTIYPSTKDAWIAR